MLPVSGSPRTRSVIKQSRTSWISTNGYQRDLPRPDPRHRIEHLSVVSDAQIARVAALGLIPVPQGRFISEPGDGVIQAMGPERLPLAYRFKSLLDAGIEVPGSSDTPVVEGSPIFGIHDLVNRLTASGAPFVPEESVSVEQAVHAYTVGSAYASCDEAVKGTIAPGMLADFVVLSDDLMQIAADRINTVEVTMTVAVTTSLIPLESADGYADP